MRPLRFAKLTLTLYPTDMCIDISKRVVTCFNGERGVYHVAEYAGFVQGASSLRHPQSFIY